MMKKVPPEYRKYVRIIIFLIILITLADIIHPIRYYKYYSHISLQPAIKYTRGYIDLSTKADDMSNIKTIMDYTYVYTDGTVLYFKEQKGEINFPRKLRVRKLSEKELTTLIEIIKQMYSTYREEKQLNVNQLGSLIDPDLSRVYESELIYNAGHQVYRMSPREKDFLSLKATEKDYIEYILRIEK